MAALFKSCSVAGCNGNAHRSARGMRGWCCSHYARWLRHGDPLKGRIGTGNALQYFLDTVLNYEGEECLPWPFAKIEGRGVLKLNGRQGFVSRHVCEATHGPPPTPEHQAAHTCGKAHEACCAKRHLVWKTPKENNADKIPHGTAQRGNSNSRTKLTEADVYAIRALKGQLSQHALARQFNIGRGAIKAILLRQSWAWLPESVPDRASSEPLP